MEIPKIILECLNHLTGNKITFPNYFKEDRKVMRSREEILKDYGLKE